MINEIFDLLSKTENCRYIDKSTLNDKKFSRYHTIISVETEITFKDKLLEIKLYVCFTEDLETNLPKIYIDSFSYDPLKYIPHINGDLSICTIDESVNYFYSIDELPKIVLMLVSKAKSIIRDKQDEEYSRQEFIREFQAYWGISYSRNDICKQEGLALIDHAGNEEIEAIVFAGGIGSYKYLIHNNSSLYSKFIDYLRKRKIAYTAISVFRVDYDKETPPFKLTYQESKQYLNASDFSQIRKQFNKFKGNDFLIVFRNIHNEYYGWKYSDFKDVNGFRKKSNWEKLSSPVIKDKNVERIAFSEITPERLSKRTDGIERKSNLSINVIGLGSVGSNLLHYLSKLDMAKINLVDPELLSVENVFRHNYGFNFVQEFKTKIAQFHLLNRNPFLEVNTFEDDITDLVKRKSTFFDAVDYSFLITGNTRSELYLLDFLQKSNTEKPMFIVWVEPYMASGQIMYVEPHDIIKAKELLLNYPHNVLKSEENGDRLYLKEGSCQSGYYPYSESYLTLFLSAIFPYIYDIIYATIKNKSHTLTWYGDISFLQSLNLVLRENIDRSQTFKILKHEF
ncbi:ThiF family adenylyltransferase [uncultured Chryseobacterium sp.]|uniref:ThiF family adenylyltransferase n=1 Tax=uncultured Chryseobacterium sp. TaxID=259322 RepID=UPI00258569F2|nr:ThiF family adenylyltransferase [uncultured Chryseobacterium sp.]